MKEPSLREPFLRTELTPFQEEVSREFMKQAKQPPGDDPVIGSLFSALTRQTIDSPLLSTILEVAEVRRQRHPGLKISEMANITRAAICCYMLDTNPGFDYRGYEDEPKWRRALSRLSTALRDTPGNPAVYTFLAHLEFDELHTTVPERYAPVELTLQAMKDIRFKSSAVSLLDIGTGMGIGPKQLLHKNHYPMQFQEVRYAPGSLPAPGHAVLQRTLTGPANKLMAQPGILAECVATDIYPVYNEFSGQIGELNYKWAKGSMRPAEQADKANMAKYDRLAHDQDTRFTFKALDITKAGDVESFRERTNGKQFDVISCLTAFYQIKEVAARQAAFHAIQSLVKPGGIAIIADFARLPSTGVRSPLPASALHMYRHWFGEDYRYRYYLYDSHPDQPRAGLQEIYFAQDSRSQRLLVRAARIIVNSRREPVVDLIAA